MDVLATNVHGRYSDGRKAHDSSDEEAQMSFQSKLPSSPQPTYHCARSSSDETKSHPLLRQPTPRSERMENLSLSPPTYARYVAFYAVDRLTSLRTALFVAVTYLFLTSF